MHIYNVTNGYTPTYVVTFSEARSICKPGDNIYRLTFHNPAFAIAYYMNVSYGEPPKDVPVAPISAVHVYDDGEWVSIYG